MAQNGRQGMEDGCLRRSFKVDSRFINLKPIGIGGNGVVYSAIDSECEKEVAIKKVCFSDKKSCKYAFRELRIMRRLKHENIVTVYEVLGSNGNSSSGAAMPGFLYEMNCVYIVQELLDTDLHLLLQQKKLSEGHICLLLYQLLRGLKYIHSANILHRDLKPSNLMINLSGLVLKIGDFGVARVLDSDYSHKGFLTDQVGTCWYRSPELIISPNDYTKAVDIWSAGCIFAEMLTQAPLFQGAQEMEQIALILTLMPVTDNDWNRVTQVLPESVMKKLARIPKLQLRDKFPSVDPVALNLLEKMLTFNSKQRITATDALKHSFLKAYSCPTDEPVASRPFQIEHEVDELSAKTLRRYIHAEITNVNDSCGTFQQSRNFLGKKCHHGSGSVSSKDQKLVILIPERDCGNNLSDQSTNASPPLTCNNRNRNITLSSFPLQQPLNKTRNFSEEENSKEFSLKNSDDDTISVVRRQQERVTDYENLSTARAFRKPEASDLASDLKMKDRLNLERRGELFLQRNNTGRRAASKMIKNRKMSKSDADSFKFAAEKQQQEKKSHKSKQNASYHDFDTLYRLPTDHLTRRAKHNRPRKTDWDNCILPQEIDKLCLQDENTNCRSLISSANHKSLSNSQGQGHQTPVNQRSKEIKNYPYWREQGNSSESDDQRL